MKHRKLAFFLAVLVVLALSSASMSAIPIEVPVGKGTIVTLKEKSKRVSLSDPALADLILISPTELLINGKQAGSTSLIIWDNDDKRTFFDVFVVGDIGDLVEQVAAIAPDSDVTVEMARESVILSGTLKKQDTMNKILDISSAYAEKVINHMTIAEAQQVMLSVKVAQIDRSKLTELGISALAKGHDAEGAGPGVIASPGGDLGGGAGYAVTPGIEGFDLDTFVPQIGVSYFPAGVSAFIQALTSKGHAKILAEPNLVVRSGEKGHFLAGSRIPIQQVSGTGADQTFTIAFEDVGIKIDFAPEVLESGVVRLKIDPAEVSSVVRFVPVGNGGLAPEIATREVTTSVDIRENESLILAGLLSEEARKNMSKIPLLGDIPVLGALFRSTRDELVQTELVFFITPTLVKTLPPGERPVLPTDKELTPQEENDLKWIPIPGRSERTETGASE